MATGERPINKGDLYFGEIMEIVRESGMIMSFGESIAFDGLTAPVEYVDYIKMIDDLLGVTTDNVVTKANIGTSADNVTPIWAYTAGTGQQDALLVAGQHSVEPVGQLAAIRAFHWLIRSDHPIARTLRATYRFVLAPNVNPGSFKAAGGGRLNPNGVNLNRNWPYFWSIYDNNGDATNAKGSAAASEPETKAIMKLFADYDFVLVIDHHNMGANQMPVDLQVGMSSQWVHANRSPVDAARLAWLGATGGTATQYGLDFDGEPLLHNWANFHMSVTRGHRHALSAIIESNSNLAGGTERVLTTMGAHRFCNMIISIIRQHAASGYRMDPARPYRTFLARANPDAATSVSQGGTLIDNTADAAIAFDSFYAVNLAGTRRTFRDLVAPTLGLFKYTISGYLESSSSTEAQRVDLAQVINGAVSGNYVSSVLVPAINGARVPFIFVGYTQVNTLPDAASFTRFALNIKKAGTITGNNPKLIRANVDVEWMPNTVSSAIPNVPALTV